MNIINIRLLVIVGFMVYCSAATTLYAEEGYCRHRTLHHKTDAIYAVGHRGAAGLKPENTLIGFSHAIQLGVDAIELDVLVTADNVLVVHHDFRLKPETTRLPGGAWLNDHTGKQINQLTFNQLKAFDVGRLKPNTRYASKYPNQVPSDGQRIPMLREVIQLLKKYRGKSVQLWIEIKTSPEQPTATPSPDSVAQKVVNLLEEETFIQRVKVLSFDWRSLIHIQKIAPSIPTVYLSSETKQFKAASFMNLWESEWTAGFDIGKHGGSIPQTIAAAGGCWWGPRYTQIDAKQVEEAHRLGVNVAVWTPNTSKAMKKMIKLGVDAIISNRPDILITTIR